MKIRTENMDLDDLFYGPLGLMEKGKATASKADEPPTHLTPSDDQKIRELSADLEFLRSRHAAEIKRWVEYDRRIKQWREQVLRVVGWLRKQLADQEMLKNELEHQKNLVRLKDMELERLRSQLEK